MPTNWPRYRGRYRIERSKPLMRERPKLRPCLGPDCERVIVSTREHRLCKACRAQTALVDPIYGCASGTGNSRTWVTGEAG